MPRARSKTALARTTKKRAPKSAVDPLRATALTDISLDGVVTIDAAGVVTDWNPAAERIFGFTRDEMTGQLLHKWVMPAADAKRHVAALKRLAEGRAPHLLNQRIEMRGLRKGGTQVDIELAITISGPGEYTGFIRDITEAKRARQAILRRDEFLTALLRHASDAVHIVDTEGRIVYSNEAVKRMVGWEVDEMVGKIGHDFVHPEDLPALSEGMQFVAEHPGVPRMQVMRIKHKTQGWRWLECVASNHVADPVIGGIIVNFRDITERLGLEQQLRHADRMDAVGRLAGGVAHDFNNLLSVIIGYAQVVLDGLPQDAPQRADILEIRDAGERAATLTRQLLAFSRKQVLQTAVLDINEVVARMDKLLRRLIGEDVKLVTRLAPGLSKTRADPGQLEQVIVNLAVNARDAMPQGGKLTIETGNAELDDTYVAEHPTATAGPHVFIAISDTGVGMDAETRQKIFEPFFTTKALGHGTGLGLSTVYGIVKQSGGTIWVYSEPDHGTTFKIYLPEVADADAAPRAKPEAGNSIGSETLLVVEDEPGVRRLVHQVLKGAGYKVLIAANATEAEDLFKDNPGISLLLTDVVLPGKGGPAIAAELRVKNPGLKVVYMSGYTDNAIVHHGVLDADVNFIEKPLRPEALLKKIRTVLDS